MKQTSFFWQVLLGLRQEFQAIMHNPSKILLFYSTVIIFTFINIWEYKHVDNDPNSKGSTKTNLNAKDLSLLPLFYLGPEIVLSQKFVQEQKFKIKDFLATNGMKASAYTTKILFACYFLLLPAALTKVIEAYCLNSFHRNQEEQKTLLFGIFLNHFITGFAIVNLNFLVSRILSEKYIIPFILVRALLPFFSLAFADILSNMENSDSILDFIEIIVRFLNPTTPLTANITDLSKQVFCTKACVYYTSIDATLSHNYTNFPLCMELFNGDTTEEIDEYCKTKKDFNWLSHLKAAIIAGLAYLIFLFLLNLVNSLMARRSKRLRQKKTHKGGQELLLQDPSTDNTGRHFSLDMSQDLARGRRQTILKDSNTCIKVRQEEILCILGDNGSGQSTLARILTGLSSPENGSIIYNEQEYNPAEIASLIGYCSQKDVPLRDNTIDENLKFFAQLRGANQDLEAIKNKAGLKEYSGSLLVSELSTDQKLMLNMAIVLLSDPQIIILDDPTAELDSSSKVTFRKLLKHLKTLKEKKTIIYTAHTVKDAELADHVVLLERDVSTSGTLSQVKENKLQGQYTLIISIRGDEATRIKTKREAQKIIEEHLICHILLDDTIDSILKYRVSYDENREKFEKLFEDLARISNIEINFKRLNLDEYLEKLQEFEPNAASLPEKIKIISASNQYNLTTQISAIFLKRLYTWKRRRSLLVLFTLLASFIFGLFLIARHCRQDDSGTFNFLLFPFLFSVIICSSIKMIFTGSELIENHKSYQIHTLNIMGLNPWAYWLGNLLADLLSQAPFILLTLILVQFIEAKNIYERILLSIATISLYANIIVYAYSLTVNKWVKNLQSILLMTFFAFFISIGTSKMTAFLLKLIGVTEDIPILLTSTFSELIMGSIIILYSLPPFQIVMGNHIMSGIVCRIFDKFQDPSKPASWPQLNQIILILITWLSIFMTLLCMVLKNSADFKKYQIKTGEIYQPADTRGKVDASVTEEHKRVLSPENTDFLQLTTLSKKESLILPDHKVENITFGIPKGSILALIGNNRGGKSEVLDIYGRETFVSSGKILLRENEDQEPQELPCPPYKSSSNVKIGFCLPTNAFWEDLSVHEHLEIYAQIKGIPNSMIKEAVKEIITCLDLEQYADISLKEMKEESVKRKLSVGLAVLGAPHLIVLDEPTKGMDPAGRNQVWKVLKELVSQESTILMATNQMEDAELKADRTGIMVDGRLEKIDPVDRVRREKDFYLKIEGIKKGEKANLQQKIESLDFKVVPGSSQESQEGKLTFFISKQKAKSKFSKAFEILAGELDEEEIRDFSFSEKSLNEVFEDLAKSSRNRRQESFWVASEEEQGFFYRVYKFFRS